MQSFLLPLALLVAQPVVVAEPAAPPAATEVAVPQPETAPAPAEPVSEIVVTAEPAPPPGDPLQELNVASFEVVQEMDEALVAPVAEAYEQIAPKPLRKALRNFLQNLREPVAAINFMLQLKIGKALETVGRFGINSTIGLAGTMDVAKKKPFNLPRRPNGFANTLGFYGVDPGAYFYLPLIGSTTVRDLVGGTIDGLFYPIVIGAPFTQLEVTVPVGTLSALDYRIENDEAIRTLNEDSANPYRATREAYLARRQAEIDALRGSVAAPVVSEDAAPAESPQNDPSPAPQP
jgi:phospholipid-binding lipoprotein MlaA